MYELGKIFKKDKVFGDRIVDQRIINDNKEGKNKEDKNADQTGKQKRKRGKLFPQDTLFLTLLQLLGGIFLLRW